MNDNTTTCGPDPVAGQRQPFARWAAKLSLLLPLAAFFLSLVSPHAHLRETKIIVGCLGVLVVLAGLVLALVALRGMRRHGRKGILGFALAGLIVNGAILLLWIVGTILLIPVLGRVAKTQHALFYPGYTRAQMEAMPEVIVGSRKIFDETIGFRLEIPADFQDSPPAQEPQCLYSFFRNHPDGTGTVVEIERLGGRLLREQVGPETIAALRRQLPEGSEVQHITMAWQRYQLDAFLMRFPTTGEPFCVCMVKVPLAREAIQISVCGPAERGWQYEKLAALLLSSLRGWSNWDLPAGYP